MQTAPFHLLLPLPHDCLVKADVAGYEFNRQSDCNPKGSYGTSKDRKVKKMHHFMRILRSVWCAASKK